METFSGFRVPFDNRNKDPFISESSLPSTIDTTMVVLVGKMERQTKSIKFLHMFYTELSTKYSILMAKLWIRSHKGYFIDFKFKK